MQFTFALLALTYIACTVVTAVPIKLDTHRLITESLTEYYEIIVDQRMYDVAEKVLFYIPRSVSHGDTQARQNVERSLDRSINFIRASVKASIHPLVLTDTSLMKDFDFVQNRLKAWSEGDQIETDLQDILLEFIYTLNKRISHQLGIIVNAAESSKLLIKQAAQVSSLNIPTVITAEWRLRKPFQVQEAVREQEQSKDVSKETEWLYHQLSAIENELLIEFDEQTDKALQIIIDTLSFNLMDYL